MNCGKGQSVCPETPCSEQCAAGTRCEASTSVCLRCDDSFECVAGGSTTIAECLPRPAP